MKPLSEIIETKQKRHFLEKIEPKIDQKYMEKLFMDTAQRIVKKVGRSDIRKIIIKESSLFVSAYHPGIANELWRRRGKILEEINEAIGQEVIKKIRIN